MDLLTKVRLSLTDKDGNKLEDVDVYTSADCVLFDDGKTFKDKYVSGELKGESGKDSTIKIGTVETTDDMTATVENSGTATAAVLNFKIPKGKDGIGLNILGGYDSELTLRADHPNGGSTTGGYIINGQYYFWDANINDWKHTDTLVGVPGKDGIGLTILGGYNSELDLQTAFPNGTTTGGYIVNGQYYFWDTNTLSWKHTDTLVGAPGKAATIKLGTIAIGDEVAVNNSGTDDAAILNFTLPAISNIKLLINNDASADSKLKFDKTNAGLIPYFNDVKVPMYTSLSMIDNNEKLCLQPTELELSDNSTNNVN